MRLYPDGRAYNAGLGALPLLRSGEPYFVTSGAVVLGLEADDDIVGVASGRLSAEDEAEVPRQCTPRWRWTTSERCAL